MITSKMIYESLFKETKENMDKDCSGLMKEVIEKSKKEKLDITEYDFVEASVKTAIEFAFENMKASPVEALMIVDVFTDYGVMLLKRLSDDNKKKGEEK